MEGSCQPQKKCTRTSTHMRVQCRTSTYPSKYIRKVAGYNCKAAIKKCFRFVVCTITRNCTNYMVSRYAIVFFWYTAIIVLNCAKIFIFLNADEGLSTCMYNCISYCNSRNLCDAIPLLSLIFLECEKNEKR
jgi:hypothetical protein